MSNKEHANKSNNAYLVVLNGPCSAGKTTIAKELQNLLPDNMPNILLGIDAFHLAIPPKKLALGAPDKNYLYAQHEYNAMQQPMTTIVHGDFITAINYARFKAVADFLDAGVIVVADELFWRFTDLLPFCQGLAKCKVYLIGVEVNEAVGDQRERQRSINKEHDNVADNFRPTGMSRASQITHSFMKYDFVIDASYKTPQESALAIVNWLNNANCNTANAFESLNTKVNDWLKNKYDQ